MKSPGPQGPGFDSCCSGLSSPVAQQLDFAARVAHLARRMKDDAVLATKVRANESPGFKAAAGDGDHDRLGGRFSEGTPARAYQLYRCAGRVVGIYVIDRNNGTRILVVCDLHHLGIDLVAFVVGFKFDVKDEVFLRRDHYCCWVEVAIALERLL